MSTHKIIVTGATGNAGSAILTAALDSSSISHVTVLSRRPPYITHPKLTSILLPSLDFPKGFDDFPNSLVEMVKDHSAVIWALGISQTQVGKDDYVKITHDYTMTAAKALSTLGTKEQPFRFIYVSGEGADQTEKSRQLFGRIKGRTERELDEAETGTFKTISVRPGAINPTAEHAPRMGLMMRYGIRSIAFAARWIVPNMQIDASDLGKVCVAIATSEKAWDVRRKGGFVPNEGLRELLKSL